MTKVMTKKLLRAKVLVGRVEEKLSVRLFVRNSSVTKWQRDINKRNRAARKLNGGNIVGLPGLLKHCLTYLVAVFL